MVGAGLSVEIKRFISELSKTSIQLKGASSFYVLKIDEFKQALIKQGIEVIDDHVRPDVIRFYVSIRSEIELNLWKIKTRWKST